MQLLGVAEEECLVFLDRSADGTAVLIAAEVRVEVFARPDEGRKSGDAVVAVIEGAATVQVVGSGPGYDVDRSNRSDASRKVKTKCGNLEFLNGLGGEVLRCSSGYRIEDAAAIDGDPCERRG